MRYLFVLIISAVSINLYGQSYNNYINLNNSGDNIGLEINRYHYALDSVANLLIQALPVSIQNDFKVFSKSFYLHTDDFTNNVQDEFDDLVVNIENQNEYYLALARVSSKEREISKYLISFSLPLDSAFVCFNEMKRTIFLVDLDSIASRGIETGKNFASLEIDVMLFMRDKVVSIIDCCQNRTFCSTCPTNEEIKKYLGSLGYKPISCSVLDEVPNPLNNNNSRSGNVLGHQNIDISLYGHEEWNTSIELDYQLDTLNTYGFTAKGMITINEDMCQFNFDTITVFDSLSNLMDLNPSDIKVRWHVFDNIEGQDDILFEKTENLDLFFEELALTNIDKVHFASPLTSNCHGTSRFKPTFIHMEPEPDGLADISGGDFDSSIDLRKGRLAHAIIEYSYMSLMALAGNDQVELEYAIPESSKLGNTGFADIVDLKSYEIYEIKTMRNLKKGIEEVHRYVRKANEFCEPPFFSPFKGGTSFPKKIILPWERNNQVLVVISGQTAADGVILYDLENGSLELDRQPVILPITEIKWQKILTVVKRMLNDLGHASQIAMDFYFINSEMKPYVIALGITAITAYLVAGAFTGGSSLTTTTQYALIASILIYTALTFEPEGYILSGYY